MTFEKFGQSNEETWPGHTKDKDKDKDKDYDKHKQTELQNVNFYTDQRTRTRTRTRIQILDSKGPKTKEWHWTAFAILAIFKWSQWCATDKVISMLKSVNESSNTNHVICLNISWLKHKFNLSATPEITIWQETGILLKNAHTKRVKDNILLTFCSVY